MAQRKQSTRPIKFTLRFYPGQDNDLIRWLSELDGNRLGVKNQAVKERLRMTGEGDPSQATVVVPVLDYSAESYPDALTASLVEVRKVVEAAVASALARFQAEGQVIGAVSTAIEEEDDEMEDLLDRLEAALVLGEEDC